MWIIIQNKIKPNKRGKQLLFNFKNYAMVTFSLDLIHWLKGISFLNFSIGVVKKKGLQNHIIGKIISFWKLVFRVQNNSLSPMM